MCESKGELRASCWPANLARSYTLLFQAFGQQLARGTLLCQLEGQALTLLLREKLPAMGKRQSIKATLRDA